MRPGNPAPTMGPGTGTSEKTLTSKPFCEKAKNSPSGGTNVPANTPPGKAGRPSWPLLKVKVKAMLAPPGPPGAPARVRLNVSLQFVEHVNAESSGILKLNDCTTPPTSGFVAT